MLDLAALVCTPRNPRHDICPLRRTCIRAKSDSH
jgi:adenine-specific DNA glycosylase